MGSEVVGRTRHGAPRTKCINMRSEEIQIQRVGVVKIDRLPFLRPQMRQIVIVGINRQQSRMVFAHGGHECRRQCGFTATRATRDRNNTTH